MAARYTTKLDFIHLCGIAQRLCQLKMLISPQPAPEPLPAYPMTLSLHPPRRACCLICETTGNTSTIFLTTVLTFPTSKTSTAERARSMRCGKDTQSMKRRPWTGKPMPRINPHLHGKGLCMTSCIPLSRRITLQASSSSGMRPAPGRVLRYSDSRNTARLHAKSDALGESWRRTIRATF